MFIEHEYSKIWSYLLVSFLFKEHQKIIPHDFLEVIMLLGREGIWQQRFARIYLFE